MVTKYLSNLFIYLSIIYSYRNIDKTAIHRFLLWLGTWDLGLVTWEFLWNCEDEKLMLRIWELRRKWVASCFQLGNWSSLLLGFIPGSLYLLEIWSVVGTSIFSGNLGLGA